MFMIVEMVCLFFMDCYYLFYLLLVVMFLQYVVYFLVMIKDLGLIIIQFFVDGIFLFVRVNM